MPTTEIFIVNCLYHYYFTFIRLLFINYYYLNSYYIIIINIYLGDTFLVLHI